MKHVGILAHSFEGAALCYRTACLEGVRRSGPHLHPEITMTGIGMHHMMDAYERGDLQAVRGLFAKSIDKLAHAGADFFICPDNTAHIALELSGDDFPIHACTSARWWRIAPHPRGAARWGSSGPTGR